MEREGSREDHPHKMHAELPPTSTGNRGPPQLGGWGRTRVPLPRVLVSRVAWKGTQFQRPLWGDSRGACWGAGRGRPGWGWGGGLGPHKKQWGQTRQTQTSQLLLSWGRVRLELTSHRLRHPTAVRRPVTRRTRRCHRGQRSGRRG